MSSALYHMQCHMSYPVYGLIGLQPIIVTECVCTCMSVLDRLLLLGHVCDQACSCTSTVACWYGSYSHAHKDINMQHSKTHWPLREYVSVKCAYVWQTMYAIVTCPLQLPSYTFRHACRIHGKPCKQAADNTIGLDSVSMRQLATESVKYYYTTWAWLIGWWYIARI